MNSINRTLLSLQNEWIKLVADPFIGKDHDEIFSKPFHLGLSEKLPRKQKLVMLIGQEASDFWTYGATENVPDCIQQWCIDYFDKQLFRAKSSSSERYNRSPFWAFFRKLHQGGVNTCWNNLDKLHRYGSSVSKEGHIDTYTMQLKLEHQQELSRQYGPDKRSLLQREIDVVQPDAIVFITGPYYASSIACAFGVDPQSLDSLAPSKANYCTRIEHAIGLNMPVFWTYHPKYLRFNSGYTQRVVDDIISSLH